MKKTVKPDKPGRKKAQLTLRELTARIAKLGIATNQNKSVGGKLKPNPAPSLLRWARFDPTHKGIVERAFAPIAKKLLDAGRKH